MITIFNMKMIIKCILLPSEQKIGTLDILEISQMMKKPYSGWMDKKNIWNRLKFVNARATLMWTLNIIIHK